MFLVQGGAPLLYRHYTCYSICPRVFFSFSLGFLGFSMVKIHFSKRGSSFIPMGLGHLKSVNFLAVFYADPLPPLRGTFLEDFDRFCYRTFFR